MFWAFVHSSGYFFPEVHSDVWQSESNKLTAEPTNAPQVKLEEQSLPQKQDQQGFFIDVTAEDLIKAGYESNKTPWNEEEDQLLKRLRDVEELEWIDIAERIPGRNSKMCYSRYRRLENHTKQIWKKAEDRLLIELVASLGENWKQISKHFQKRTHKQLKEHYMNYLRPEIKRQDWSLEQDLKFVELLKVHGKNWKIIEEVLKDRTQNQIKNRYFGRLKRISDKKSLKLKNESPSSSQL